ncbi:MAG: DUF4149 domain-containing protein [Jaaginema sp. PMC 1079.18]|nr:DUF4149 domain-containing protein [Jaaginema sp. PMC 1080.18]MEC4853081.1 DUF4149 domain-containing protein [Jaaginema sp. PMC 1079.18]MEC4864968.1 DUF4149 domain-containing protein [Jaaginema sp. PMC 1078.18]
MNAGSENISKHFNWSIPILLALAFWLSSSLLLDLAIVPGLYASGMMSQSGFASAGYLIFGTFNHIELLCAGLVLTGCLVLWSQHQFTPNHSRRSLVFAAILLAIAIIYTYILTPQMSGLAIQLNLFEPMTMPPAMMEMHSGYWVLEVLKLAIGATLLRWCYLDSARSNIA